MSGSGEILSTEAFCEWMDINGSNVGAEVLKVRFDPKEFVDRMAQSQRLQIIPSSDGPVSDVQGGAHETDQSKSSQSFDLHTDGRSLVVPPKIVLLHCEQAGKTAIPTILTDTRAAVDALCSEDIACLAELDNIFLSRDGEEYPCPLIEKTPKGEWYSNFASRGYIRPRKGQDISRIPAIASYVPAVDRLLDQFKRLTTDHIWERDDMLVFDNHRYIHGRRSASVDPERHLHRSWLHPKSEK